jgi:hypothetical protein
MYSVCLTNMDHVQEDSLPNVACCHHIIPVILRSLYVIWPHIFSVYVTIIILNVSNVKTTEQTGLKHCMCDMLKQEIKNKDLSDYFECRLSCKYHISLGRQVA